MAIVMTSNDFDVVAGVYDKLAKMVFGKSIRDAQTNWLELITKESAILVIGGGTGWITNEILRNEENVSIDYLEKSDKMMRLAESILAPHQRKNVNFIRCAFEDWNQQTKYDFIICNFFLDVFAENKLTETVIPKIRSLLAVDGKLLVTDFRTNEDRFKSLWQKPLLLVMHLFFRMTCKLESRALADLGKLIVQADFKKEKEKLFFEGMIFSSVYKVRN